MEIVKIAGPPVVGLLGGWLAGRYGAKAALESWRRSRQDMADKQTVDLIQQLSTDLAGLSHCAMWLTWKAKFNPASLKAADIARYEDDTYVKVPRLLGNLAALAAIDLDTANSLHPFVKEICVLDGKIALAAIAAPTENPKGLADLHDISKASYEELLTTLSCRAAHVLTKPGNSK